MQVAEFNRLTHEYESLSNYDPNAIKEGGMIKVLASSFFDHEFK